MKFNVVRNHALQVLENFKSQGTIGASERMNLIEPAAQSEIRRLTEEFRSSKSQDGGEADLADAKNVLHTRRGPTDREFIERDLETKTEFKGNPRNGEMSTHQLATLKGDSEPYHETYEFTRFRPDGIAHVTITIVGDGGVGCGAVVSRGEFLSHEEGKSWREDAQTRFLDQDMISIYNQGTYRPSV